MGAAISPRDGRCARCLARAARPRCNRPSRRAALSGTARGVRRDPPCCRPRSGKRVAARSTPRRLGDGIAGGIVGDRRRTQHNSRAPRAETLSSGIAPASITGHDSLAVALDVRYLRKCPVLRFRSQSWKTIKVDARDAAVLAATRLRYGARFCRCCWPYPPSAPPSLTAQQANHSPPRRARRAPHVACRAVVRLPLTANCSLLVSRRFGSAASVHCARDVSCARPSSTRRAPCSGLKPSSTGCQTYRWAAA